MDGGMDAAVSNALGGFLHAKTQPEKSPWKAIFQATCYFMTLVLYLYNRNISKVSIIEYHGL
jgi:hypothetical protein